MMAAEEMANLLSDLRYLTGASPMDILATLDDMDTDEVLYTLRELKKLTVQKLMHRDLPTEDEHIITQVETSKESGRFAFYNQHGQRVVDHRTTYKFGQKRGY